MMRNCLFFLLFLAVTTQNVIAKNSLAPSITRTIDSHIQKALDEHYFPGAQLIIGNKEGIIYSKNYGYLDYSKEELVDSTTLYDLASCTKIFATTLSVMKLIDDGKLSLYTKISERVAGTDTMAYGKVMVKDLLYHGSGFRPTVGIAKSLVKSANEETPLLSSTKNESNPYRFDTRLYVSKDIKYDSTYLSENKTENSIKISSKLYLNECYKLKLDSMINDAYRPERYGYYLYSDLNYYFLQKIVESTTSVTLNEYVQGIYDDMDIDNIGYNPLSWSEKECIAPTEYDVLFRRDTLRGIVHDEMACIQGGMAGHAGLFSSASTLSALCQMFLNNGIAPNGKQIIKPETIKQFTLAKRYATGALRGLGFDKLNPVRTPYSSESYGHTGYTGTYFWIEPEDDFYVILLTNRVHPTRANKKLGAKFRGELWGIVKENL